VRARFAELATERQRRQMDADAAAFRGAGAPADIARTAAQARYAHLALPVVDLARRLDRPLDLVAGVYFALAGRLGLDRVLERVNELPRQTRWDTMARAALRDDLQSLHADLARAALEREPEAGEVGAVIAAWEAAVDGVPRVSADLAEITAEGSGLARMSVALRLVRTLLA